MNVTSFKTNPLKTIISTPMFLTLAVLFLFTQIAAAGSTNYFWNTTSGGANWSTSGSWTPNNGEPGPAIIDTAIFTNVGASTGAYNNTVDSSYAGTVTNLIYNNFNPSGSYVYPTTLIPSGKTLTVANFFSVGGEVSPSSSSWSSYALFSGAGTLKVTASRLFVTDYSASSSANLQPCAFLDLSGLTNFIYNNPIGTFAVSSNEPPLLNSGNPTNRCSGSVTLACKSNNITAAIVSLGCPSVQNGGCGMLPTGAGFGVEAIGVANNNGATGGGNPAVLALGPGTNIINTAALNVGGYKNGFIVTNNGGGLRIRGVTGADSDANVNITVGNRNAGGGSSGSSVGWLLFNGCSVDIKANAFILGQDADFPNSSTTGGGLLQFDTGTVSANSFLMAYNIVNNATALAIAVASGKVQVGAHGALNIGAGQVFAMATAKGSGSAAGFLVVSNGLINCFGPIVMGASSNSVPPSSAGFANGLIQLIGSGTLNMGANSYVGSLSNPITALLLDTNSVFSLSVPAASYTNVCVNTLAWPSPDTNLTLSLAAIPFGLSNGQVFPFLHYSNLTNIVNITVPSYTTFSYSNASALVNPTPGTFFNNPKLTLPTGVSGNLSTNANMIYITLTTGTELAGVPELTNGFFIQGSANWTATGSGAVITNSGGTYPNTGPCTFNPQNIVPFPGTGTNVAKLTGSFVSGGSTNAWSQSVPVLANSAIIPGATVLTPGAKVAAGGEFYVAHDDIMSGSDSFYYEADFLDTNGTIFAAYQSSVISNLTCGSAILDAWHYMAVTNKMTVTGGVVGGVASTIADGSLVVPPQSATAKFKAVFIQRNATDTGSVYIGGANVGFLLAPVGPTLSVINPNLVTLSTNTTLTCVATSSITTVSSVQVTVSTTTLGSSVTNTTVYTNGSSGLTITGLGTSSANISLALHTNTIYSSVVVAMSDADGLSAVSSPASFDTLVATLVIEAADFNYSGGSFFDTTANGGFALYQGLKGTTNIDEFKLLRTNAQSYYRPTDDTVIQAVATGTSGIEQKFVTALANGNTTDIEVGIAFDTPGDWQNYTRTFANSGGSAKPGLYNVWCYLADNGSGAQVGFYQVTNASPPTTSTQLTNFIGNFGSSTFSDNSFNNYVYTPLVDQFGNQVALSITNGVQTFRGQIAAAAIPNVAFYMFVPAVPVLSPVMLNFLPNGAFQPTSNLTFTVGPAQGAAISTNSIWLVVNGVTIPPSALTFASIGGGQWTVTYPLLSNQTYSATVNVTNVSGSNLTYTASFNTMNINNFHWMAVDYDFSTNNNSSSGGSIGDGWTGALFIDNPIPTGDTNAPVWQSWQVQAQSYFVMPTAFVADFGVDPSGNGAIAHQGVDVNWVSNSVQWTGGTISNSIYRLSTGGYNTTIPIFNGGDGVGNQIAGDSPLLPEFIFARTNNASAAPDGGISEFNIGYFYTPDWLNYTRTYPTGTFNVWGRLAANSGDSFTCTLSRVTSGAGTSNQTTQVIGTFSDANGAGFQSYHWVPLMDTNGNPVYLTLSNKATLRLTSPTNATSAGHSLNPLFFTLAPSVPSVSSFSGSASIDVNGNVKISIPTQRNHAYTVWFSSSLSPASWTQVFGPVDGNGSTEVISQSLGSSVGFYRIKAQ